MVLTRATDQRGSDGMLGAADDVREHTNTTTPLRGLRPGRYVVEVRVGASRTALGPAARRTVTVGKARARAAGRR